MTKTVAVILLVISSVFFLWASAWGVADFLTLKPRHLIRLWSEDNKAFDKTELADSFSKLNMATTLNPYSADYIQVTGVLYEWAALEEPVWSEHAHKYRPLAIEQYRRAVFLRPTWGFAWAHIAHAKLLEQQFDEEAVLALERAMVFTPWAPGVQRKVIWVGFTAWDILPEQIKEQLKETVIHALKVSRKQAKFVIDSAVYLRLEDQLRPLLSDDRDKNHLEIMINKRKS